MITIIYQFKHNVTWHCRINQFFSFPEQLQSWIYVFLVGDHRYAPNLSVMSVQILINLDCVFLVPHKIMMYLKLHAQ